MNALLKSIPLTLFLNMLSESIGYLFLFLKPERHGTCSYLLKLRNLISLHLRGGNLILS